MMQEESVQSPKEQQWGIRHLVFGWLLGFVASYLVMIAMSLIDQNINLEDPSLGIIAILQVALWVGILGIPLWLHLRKGVSWKDFGWSFKINDVFPGFLIGLGTQIVLGLLVRPLILFLERFFGDIDVSEPARELVDKATGSDVLFLFLIVVLIGPVVEEMFYRGFVLKALEKRMSSRSAMIVSSLFFALAHFQLWQFPVLFSFGLVAAYLVRKYNRLSRAVWAHVGFNAGPVVALLLQG
ncbi:MAG: CPBP family intramembrane metalloprotease [Acidimicrobiales bacterium]|nr:CPBP family intramembrane metalloprotease [Acidimicrobiales bacterium]